MMYPGIPQDAARSMQLLSRLYNINITAVGDHGDLERFSERFRIHRMQHMFSPDALRQLLRKLEDRQIFALTDAFMLRTNMFYLEGVPVFFGPFSSVMLSTRDIRLLMKRYPVPGLTEDTLMHYMNSFPCISEAEAIHIISSLLHMLYPEEPAREIVNINYLEGPEVETEERMLGKRKDNTRLLEARYAHEQAFIAQIKAGNARQAIQELRNMQQDVAYLKRIGTTLENERVGAAIVRTTARLSAYQAGLPAVVCNRISNQNTVSVIRATRVDEIQLSQEQMIREFCKAIKKHVTEQYSALVQSALYCIRQDYASDITVQSMADELDVSVNHLIAEFKKEMQVTPNVYLRTYRLEQAARLLAATDRTVQDIAASVGIPDANYMIKMFKAQYGETPAAYRKKYRV